MSHSPVSSLNTLSAIADSSSLPASASKMPLSGVGVYCWKPCGYSSSSAAVWSFFRNVKSTMFQSFRYALVSGSEFGAVPR